MAKKSNKKTVGKKNVVSLDFTGVETTSKVPDGDYLVKVNKVEMKQKEGEDTYYLQFQLGITEGKHAGKNLRHTNSLKTNALFALRNTLEALNYPIPSGAFDLDLEAIVGLEMAVSVENEEYNGKDQSRVVDVFTVEDFEAEEEDEDDEAADEDGDEAAEDEAGDEEEDTDEDDADDDSDDDEDSDDDDSDEDDDEEVEDYTQEELEEMEEEELIEAAEEYEVKPVYTGKGAKKKLSVKKTIAAIMEEING